MTHKVFNFFLSSVYKINTQIYIPLNNTPNKKKNTKKDKCIKTLKEEII